jgi:hypothetical protein
MQTQSKELSISSVAIESLVLRGDLSALSPQQKTEYYSQLCARVGLDPATTPFMPMKLQGKEILYATKGAAEQLRKLHSVAVTITGREKVEDVYVVTAKACTPDGRVDESTGAVPIAGLKGDALCNAIMKAETKAKRRVTLSIIGLGMLDESELETIQQDKFAQLKEHVAQDHKSVALVKEMMVKEKKSEALPPLPDRVADIPASILLGIPQLANANLQGVKLVDMTTEQLEMVNEAVGSFYERYSQSKAASENGMKWLRAILTDANAVLTERFGGGALQ